MQQADYSQCEAWMPCLTYKSFIVYHLQVVPLALFADNESKYSKLDMSYWFKFVILLRAKYSTSPPLIAGC